MLSIQALRLVPISSAYQSKIIINKRNIVAEMVKTAIRPAAKNSPIIKSWYVK
jgi:hypothetical protein